MAFWLNMDHFQIIWFTNVCLLSMRCLDSCDFFFECAKCSLILTSLKVLRLFPIYLKFPNNCPIEPLPDRLLKIKAIPSLLIRMWRKLICFSLFKAADVSPSLTPSSGCHIQQNKNVQYNDQIQKTKVIYFPAKNL